MAVLSRKMTLNDLRAARSSGTRMAMLTCYDYTMATVMHASGVPAILVGDSAASVILGHPNTLPVSLAFMMEITAAVRRGAPLAFLVADMPFGSYQESLGSAARNVFKVVKRTGCDCVKLEVTESHSGLVRRLADAGVAVMAHLGLRPQAVGLTGHRFQGKTAREAGEIVTVARSMQSAGAAALLLEAVPPEVAELVVASVRVPVIGCGAGPACHGSVVVTHDSLGLTPRQPRFVPKLTDIATPMQRSFQEYVRIVEQGEYPAPEHNYQMPEAEKCKLTEQSAAASDPQAWSL